MLRENRHVALKILSVHASNAVEENLSSERTILQKISRAAPSHRGFPHVLHLLHEFKFESYLGQHVCFVLDVLTFNIPTFRAYMPELRFPINLIFHITKHVLQGLEYLHDECDGVHSGLAHTV